MGVSGTLFWFGHGHRTDVFNVDIVFGLVVPVVVVGKCDGEVSEVVEVCFSGALKACDEVFSCCWASQSGCGSCCCCCCCCWLGWKCG